MMNDVLVSLGVSLDGFLVDCGNASFAESSERLQSRQQKRTMLNLNEAGQREMPSGSD
jgi:hypothetical protein